MKMKLTRLEIMTRQVASKYYQINTDSRFEVFANEHFHKVSDVSKSSEHFQDSSLLEASLSVFLVIGYYIINGCPAEVYTSIYSWRSRIR